MKAALLYGINDLRLEDIDVPAINDDEILIGNRKSFICGTDVRMLKNGNKNITPGKGIIIGHEFSGVIEKVGKNIKEYSKGNRVFIAPNIGCGTCLYCISGNSHMCKDYQAFGIHINGGFSEYVKIPAKAITHGNVIKLSNSVSFSEAALIEPFSCVYNGFERAQISPGDTVLIQGAGPIGIMHAKLAKMAGASKIIVSDILKERLEMVKNIDHSFIIVFSDDVRKEVDFLTGKKGVDVSITACPSPEAQALSVELGAVNGRIIFFGGLPENRQNVPINTNIIHYKQLIVSGTSKASLGQIYKSIKLLESNIIQLKDLISAEFPIGNVQLAFDKAIEAKGLKYGITYEQ
jgi:L-iditol 2-dehydrogenase